MKINILIIYLVSIWISLISFSQSNLLASSAAVPDLEYCDTLQMKTTKQACQQAMLQEQLKGIFAGIAGRNLTDKEVKDNLDLNKNNIWAKACKDQDRDNKDDIGQCLIEEMTKANYFSDNINFLKNPYYLAINLNLIIPAIRVTEQVFLIFKMILKQDKNDENKFNLKLYSYNKIIPHKIPTNCTGYIFCNQEINKLEEYLEVKENWYEIVRTGEGAALKLHRETLSPFNFKAFMAFNVAANDGELSIKEDNLLNKGTRYLLKFESTEEGLESKVDTKSYTEKLLEQMIQFFPLVGSSTKLPKEGQEVLSEIINPMLKKYINPIMSNKIKYLGFKKLDDFKNEDPAIYIYPDKLGEKTFPIVIYNKKTLMEIVRAFKANEISTIKTFFEEE